MIHFSDYALCFLLLASICHGARVELWGGTSLNGPITTNSVLADISLEDGVAVSCSQTDSQISLAPFDDDWAAVDEGTLFGDLTVVSGGEDSRSAPQVASRWHPTHTAMTKASYSNITVCAHEARLYLLARMWHSI